MKKNQIFANNIGIQTTTNSLHVGKGDLMSVVCREIGYNLKICNETKNKNVLHKSHL